MGRLIRARQKTSAGTTLLTISNSYDNMGRAENSTYVMSDRTMSYLINYTPDSNLVNRIAMPSASENSTISYTYDEFERLSRKRISVSLQHRFEEYYEYYTFTKEGKTYTTQLVSKLTLKSYL